MTKDDALDLALEALEEAHYKVEHKQNAAKREEAITAIRQARALDKKAENARELGLDYEPVWCGHCNGSGRMVRDPDIGTDQECFVCDGAGVPEAPVQEPVHQWRQKHSPYWYDGYPDNDDGGGPYETRILYTTPPAQPAPVQEPVAKVYRHGKSSNGTPWHGVHWFDEGVNMPDGTLLYTAPPTGPVPWTKKQEQEYQKKKREQAGEALV